MSEAVSGMVNLANVLKAIESFLVLYKKAK